MFERWAVGGGKDVEVAEEDGAVGEDDLRAIDAIFFAGNIADGVAVEVEQLVGHVGIVEERVEVLGLGVFAHGDALEFVQKCSLVGDDRAGEVLIDSGVDDESDADGVADGDLWGEVDGGGAAEFGEVFDAMFESPKAFGVYMVKVEGIAVVEQRPREDEAFWDDFDMELVLLRELAQEVAHVLCVGAVAGGVEDFLVEVVAEFRECFEAGGVDVEWDGGVFALVGVFAVVEGVDDLFEGVAGAADEFGDLYFAEVECSAYQSAVLDAKLVAAFFFDDR